MCLNITATNFIKVLFKIKIGVNFGEIHTSTSWIKKSQVSLNVQIRFGAIHSV